MATTKTREELVRLSWLTELRRQGHRQCEGELFNGVKVCALGLLVEVAGQSKDWADDLESYNPIGALAGLDPMQIDRVINANDGDGTFAEIADVVAGWFPS